MFLDLLPNGTGLATSSLRILGSSSKFSIVGIASSTTAFSFSFSTLAGLSGVMCALV